MSRPEYEAPPELVKIYFEKKCDIDFKFSFTMNGKHLSTRKTLVLFRFSDS